MADPELPVDITEPDPPFEPTERLYRRIPGTEVAARSVSDLSIPFPAFSVDRERHRRRPADMLIGWPGMGIAAFRVGDIPPAITSDDGRTYEFGVEHRPLVNNYAHSEVHTYQGGSRLAETGKEPPKLVRKKFRDLLRQKIEILEVL